MSKAFWDQLTLVCGWVGGCEVSSLAQVKGDSGQSGSLGEAEHLGASLATPDIDITEESSTGYMERASGHLEAAGGSCSLEQTICRHQHAPDPCNLDLFPMPFLLSSCRSCCCS